MEEFAKQALDKLTEVSEVIQSYYDEYKNESEQFWESLSSEDQLKVFCAVCRRIHEGEIVDNGTYRYVLYDVFGFGPEAYAPAQLAGYMDIHNAIYSRVEVKETIKKELEEFSFSLGFTESQTEKNVEEFMNNKSKNSF